MIFQSIVRLKGGWDEQIKDKDLVTECKHIVIGPSKTILSRDTWFI